MKKASLCVTYKTIFNVNYFNMKDKLNQKEQYNTQLLQKCSKHLQCIAKLYFLYTRPQPVFSD